MIGCYISSEKALIEKLFLFDPGICKDMGCPNLELSYSDVYVCNKLNLKKFHPRILSDREEFYNFTLEFYKERTYFSRDKLIDSIVKDIEIQTKGKALFPVKRSEVAYKFHKWFLSNIDIDLLNKFRFSSREKAREIIIEICKDGYIRDLSYDSLRKTLRINTYTYFKSLNDLREILGKSPIYRFRRRFKTKEEGREAIKNFLLKNPDKRTQRGVRKELKISLYSYFDSMESALKYAGIEHKNLRKLKNDIIKTIEKEPKIGVKKLERQYGIDFRNHFTSSREPYIKAGVEIPWRLLTIEERKKRIKDFIRKNPDARKIDIREAFHTDLRSYFTKKEFLNIYNELGLEIPWRFLSRKEKIRHMKKFIKANPDISKTKLTKKFSIDLRDYPEIKAELEKD